MTGTFEFVAHQSVSLATPIALAALGETLVECAGIVNLGLEGAMLSGAFFGAIGSYYSGSALGGAACGIAAAMLYQSLFAWVVVRWRADEIIAGTALNLLASGVTAVLWRATLGLHSDASRVVTFPEWPVPLLSELPFIGKLLFHHHAITYAAFLAVPCTWLFLKSSCGLRLRACGEAPRAALDFGISVARLRTIAILACGALAGLGGAALSIAEAGTFVEDMTAGRGYIAIALVIFGGYRALGSAVCSLVFGLALALQFRFQAVSPYSIPPEFFRSLPYIVSLVVLAGFAGKRRAPDSLGKGMPPP